MLKNLTQFKGVFFSRVVKLQRTHVGNTEHSRNLSATDTRRRTYLSNTTKSKKNIERLIT